MGLPAAVARWYEEPMLILAGTIRLAPGSRDAAKPALTAMVEASRAEPGCLAYALSFDVEDDHLVHVFEAFEDEEALATHRGSAHMAAWRDARAQLGISERNMREYFVSAYRQI